MKTFLTYVKDFITENISDYVGYDIYGADLAYTLTEDINRTGSATCNRYKAMEYIKEWFEDAAEVYRYQVENYGSASINPFEDPEGWMVCMIIEGVNNILGQCDAIEDVWSDVVELTADLAQKIIGEVLAVKELEF